MQEIVSYSPPWYSIFMIAFGIGYGVVCVVIAIVHHKQGKSNRISTILACLFGILLCAGLILFNVTDLKTKNVKYQVHKNDIPSIDFADYKIEEQTGNYFIIEKREKEKDVEFK